MNPSRIETWQNQRVRPLNESDPEIAGIIENEARREEESLELIASENFTSRAVMEACGSVLTNKYAEGYPGHRWYEGCEYVDEIERVAIKRGLELFNAEYINVQPHSGSQANTAVYTSVLNPGDTILAMKLAHGGHLTHGHPKNISGMFFKVVSYGVSPETETIDYDEIERMAHEHKPRMIVAGASAYPRQIDFPRLRKIADAVGAWLMIDMAHFAGLVAGGVYPSPVPIADFVTFTTHKTMRGPRGGIILCRKEFGAAVDSAVFPGNQGGPAMHIIAAKAVCFKEAMSPEFKQYAANILSNCLALSRELIKRNWELVTGGTDTHLLLMKLAPCGLTGKEAASLLESVNITTNKNLIPFDQKSPFVTSGLRLGTAALTTRGMGEVEMVQVADMITELLMRKGAPEIAQRVRQQVADLCVRFPLYK